MPWDYDAYLQDQYEESCGNEDESELDEDDGPEEMDPDEINDLFNERQEAEAIAYGIL